MKQIKEQLSIYNSIFQGLNKTLDTKVCSMCKQRKSYDEFAKDGGANYLRHECRTCASKQTRLVNKLKKSVVPPGKDYVCPICKRNADQISVVNDKKKNIWCCDHDHVTQKFRAFICQKCNLGLGNMNDDPDRLIAAAEYLKRHKT